MRYRFAFVALAASLLVAPLGAQTPDTSANKPGGKTTTLPLKYSRSAKFTTDEGTWLSLDVSPDGRSIVFDLAGDLYTLPIGGGKATRITDGPGYDCQPRFSPDGKKIVFQSDRSGSENLYTVDVDGKNVKAFTTGEKQEFLSPVWSPDGRYLMVSRYGYNSFGNYDLYLYNKEGGSGVKLNVANASTWGPAPPTGGIPGNNFLGAAFGKSPRYLYYSTKSGGFGYNIQSFGWSVQRYDFETGERKTIAASHGGSFRPLLSRDGKWLVYATRRDTSTSFRIRNLETSEETWLIDHVQRDDQESRYTRDVMPGSAFMPDGSAIITAYNGKIWRVDVPSGKATMIPFSADVDVQLAERTRFDYPINDSTLTVTQIRGPRLSPDNKRVVFTALDRLYVMDVTGGTPKRLTNGTMGEHHPVWSPDGQWIAYVTWNDSVGDVYRVHSDGSGAAERLTRTSAYYSHVNYNPGGSRLLVTRSPRQGYGDYGAERHLVWLPAAGGETTLISETLAGGFPYFVKGDSSRIYIGTESMRWDGTDKKSHLRGLGGAQFSPDGERLFTIAKHNLMLSTTPVARDINFDINAQGSPLVARRVSSIVADFPAWSDDGKLVTWAAGRFFFVYDLAKGDSLVADSVRAADAKKDAPPAKPDTAKGAVKPDSAKPKPAYEASRQEIVIVVPRDRPMGVVALRNARIITIKGDEVIEKGDIVITNGRITAVGKSGQVKVPSGAQVFDLKGKTIMPGMIDVHAHPHVPGDVHTLQPWTYAANLAYGVTTTRDPQTGSTDVLSYQDLVATGEIVGPRIYSTGPGIFDDDDYSTLDKARDVLRRYSDYYFTNTLKQYMSGDRKARQHIIMAARELKIAPTLEGGLDFKKNITEAIDGYAGSEHAYPITPLYKDMVEIIAKTGITYTPTLLVIYGGPWSENYMYEKYASMHDDAKLRRFVPHSEIDGRFLRRPQWFADDQYAHKRISEQAAKIVKAGGHVGLGGHGQLDGLGDQWELWLLQSGGMRPIDAIRCATLFGAEEIGLDKDLGSLEVGKLADLIVLDKNPLDDIHNTIAMRYVMKNGRLYDGNTLDEVWPRKRAMKAGWWLRSESVAPVHFDLQNGGEGGPEGVRR